MNRRALTFDDACDLSDQTRAVKAMLKSLPPVQQTLVAAVVEESLAW
jgi:hypothetical protein